MKNIGCINEFIHKILQYATYIFPWITCVVMSLPSGDVTLRNSKNWENAPTCQTALGGFKDKNFVK